jgi:FkbM family methyltransferase
MKIAAGRHDDVRLGGVRLAGPHPRGLANTAVEVAAGEYSARGFEVRPGDRVVDVGANVGAFAVLAASRGAMVDAYEPHPETFAHLERNTTGLAVRCVQAAVVGEATPGGTVALAPSEESTTRHRLGRRGIEVPAVGISKVIAAGCDLLKIDCEGAEFELVDGAGPEAWRAVWRVACEVHPWAGEVERFASTLERLGFTVWWEPRRAGLAIVFAAR